MLASVSRKAALDLDPQGKPGWLVGLLILVAPPVGLGLWLVMRDPVTD